MKQFRKIIITASLADSLINFRRELLEQMLADGHQVIACAPATESSKTISVLKVLGVEFCEIPLSRTGVNPLNDFKLLLALFKLFKEKKPDVLLFYTIKPVIYGSLIGGLCRINDSYSMITGLGYAFTAVTLKAKIIRKIVSTLYKIGLKCNKQIFFQNSDDLNLFCNNRIIKNKDKCILINGSGVNIHKFELTSLPQKISFLLIARLLIEKGIYEYVEAAKIIKSKYPNIKFKLVGWLDLNPSCICKEDLDRWVNEGIIEYLGKLDDVSPAIANSSVYVLPSYREGTPRTVLEAMAMGRPIITSDAPGCRETVINKMNGFLIPVRDSQALADAMEFFIKNPIQINEMGLVSRKIVEKKYNCDIVNRVILNGMNLL